MREAVYIVSRTWNSSFRVLASDFLFHRLSQFPVCLEHLHISMVGDVSSSPGAGNNSNPGGLCHWSWKRTNDCDQWHLSHLLSCPPMWLIPALFCLPVCFSDAYLFLMTWTDAGKHIRLGRCTQCSLSLSLSVDLFWLSAEKRRAAGHVHADSVESQAADGDFPGGGTAWRAGPLPLHHPVPQRCRRVQLWRTNRQR